MGNQVSPSEVEAVIQQMAGVQLVCVTGVPNTTGTSDLVTAVIVKDSSYQLTAEEVMQHVAKNLSDPKHLRGGVFFVEQLPMTSNGKVVRRKVRDIILDKLS